MRHRDHVETAGAIKKPSFRGDAKHRTRNLEIPGLVLTHHPGMTEVYLLYPHLPGFPADHRLLAGDAPVVAGQRAALAERAMARHHERKRVLADRGTDRARGFRAFDVAGDVR